MLIAGADDFIGKPFSIVQLIARVKAALRLKDAQDRSDTLAHTLLKLNQQLENNLRARDSDLIDARNALTLAIAELVAHRGVESGAHLLRIQQYVRALAQEALGSAYFATQLDANYIQMLEGTAPLHDLGMIGLPEYIFLKPGKLSDEERLIMRSHTTMGADILQKVARSHGFSGRGPAEWRSTSRAPITTSGAGRQGLSRSPGTMRRFRCRRVSSPLQTSTTPCGPVGRTSRRSRTHRRLR